MVPTGACSIVLNAEVPNRLRRSCPRSSRPAPHGADGDQTRRRQGERGWFRDCGGNNERVARRRNLPQPPAVCPAAGGIGRISSLVSRSSRFRPADPPGKIIQVWGVSPFPAASFAVTEAVIIVFHSTSKGATIRHRNGSGYPIDRWLAGVYNTPIWALVCHNYHVCLILGDSPSDCSWQRVLARSQGNRRVRLLARKRQTSLFWRHAHRRGAFSLPGRAAEGIGLAATAREAALWLGRSGVVSMLTRGRTKQQRVLAITGESSWERNCMLGI